MTEFEHLKTLNAHIPEPSPAHLAPVYVALQQAIGVEEATIARTHFSRKPQKSPRIKGVRAPLVRWFLVAAAGLTAITLAGTQLFSSAPPVQAAPVLKEASASAAANTELTPAAGQYLQVKMNSTIMWALEDESGVTSGYDDILTVVYIPADRGDEWVRTETNLTRDAADGVAPTVERAENGAFTDTHKLTLAKIAEVPTSSGKAALAYFDDRYEGGSNSRDEDNYVRIVDLLRTGLVPSQTRAAMYEALALIPGTISIPNVTVPGGPTGVGIGRSEEADHGTFTSQLIIDPATGVLLGERHAYNEGDFDTFSYFAYEVVDSAP